MRHLAVALSVAVAVLVAASASGGLRSGERTIRCDSEIGEVRVLAQPGFSDRVSVGYRADGAVRVSHRANGELLATKTCQGSAAHWRQVTVRTGGRDDEVDSLARGIDGGGFGELSESIELVVRAGGGVDSVLGHGGRDGLDGEGGRDQLRGYGRRDTLIGGRGEDALFAGSGRDSIASADGGRDLVVCGSNRDRATADRADDLSDCERVRIP